MEAILRVVTPKEGMNEVVDGMERLMGAEVAESLGGEDFEIVDTSSMTGSIEECPAMQRSACVQCGRTDTPTRRCGGCHTAHYCGRACQLAAWPAHRATCHVLRQMASSETLDCTTLPTPPVCDDVDVETVDVSALDDEAQKSLQAATASWLLSMPTFANELHQTLATYKHTDTELLPLFLITANEPDSAFSVKPLAMDHLSKMQDPLTLRYIQHWTRPDTDGEGVRVVLLCIRNGRHCFLRLRLGQPDDQPDSA